MPFPGLVGAAEAGVGPSAFLAIRRGRPIQGLVDLPLKNPPIRPAKVSDVVTWIPAVAIDRGSNNASQSLRHLVQGVRGFIVWVGLDGQRSLIQCVGVVLSNCVFLPTLFDVGQISVQGSRVGSKNSLTPRVLAGKLRHHSDMEHVPVADELLFGCKGESGCPKCPTVIHPAHVSHRAGVDLWLVTHLVQSGFVGSADDSIKHEIWIRSRGLDHSSCCSGSHCLAWADESH